MRQVQFLLILSVLVVSIVSCSTTGVPESNNTASVKRYNIVIVLDGIDRLAEEKMCSEIEAIGGNGLTDSDVERAETLLY